jgi:hypothetical protein
MSYLEFLNWLLSFGPKLPSLMASVERIVTVFMEEAENIKNILGFKESFKSTAPTVEEAAAEQEVIAAVMGGQETFAGPLSRILDFIRNNQELILLIMSLFGKK